MGPWRDKDVTVYFPGSSVLRSDVRCLKWRMRRKKVQMFLALGIFTEAVGFPGALWVRNPSVIQKMQEAGQEDCLEDEGMATHSSILA